MLSSGHSRWPQIDGYLELAQTLIPVKDVGFHRNGALFDGMRPLCQRRELVGILWIRDEAGSIIGGARISHRNLGAGTKFEEFAVVPTTILQMRLFNHVFQKCV